MTTVGLISCVKSKRPHRCAAKDLYCSQLFRAQRQYIERITDRWFILSAKYGLVTPDQIIDPYEQTLNGTGIKTRIDWSRKVWEQLEPYLKNVDIVVVLAGEKYIEYLVLYIHGGIDIQTPLRGLTMGHRLRRLKELNQPSGFFAPTTP